MVSSGFLAVISGLCLVLVAPKSLAAEASYFRDIAPIIQRQCQGCHQPNLKSSNLDLTSYESFKTGGKRGPAAGILIGYLTGESKPQMPLGQPPLPAEQIDLFRAWIAAGAKDDTPPEARDDIAPDKPIVYTLPPVINAVAFSPDGKTLAVSGNREVLLHSLEGAATPRRLPGLSDRILSLAFSKDGSTLVAAGGTPARFGEIQIWDVAAGKLRRSITMTGDTVFGVSISPDASKIAVGCTDNTVRIVDTVTGKELFKIGNHENWVLGTVFGVDGKRLVSVGRDQAAKLTDASNGQFIENINAFRGELAAVARHPARDVILIGGAERVPYLYTMDRAASMKIADDSTLIRKFEMQDGAIFALAFSPDGSRIAVAGAADDVPIYQTETGERTATCKGRKGTYAVAFSPDGEQLATGGFDGKVRICEVKSGKLVRDFVPVPVETQMASAR